MTAGFILAVIDACACYDAQAVTDSLHSDSAARAIQDSINRAQPHYIVDSIFPIAEEIRRFNADSPPVDSLRGGAKGRQALVRRFTAALAKHDTATLLSLFVTRAEFGQLVFPESPHVRPPFKTKPSVIWGQLVNESEKSLSRLLQRLAGPAVQISGLECPAPERHGKNLIWRRCTVLVRDPQRGEKRMCLFTILERGGRAKFLLYTTDF
ncbi:MAG TPA: hypothetical protein VJ717_05315 [Gemmatimonadaceae bacterium]|nr:hypothetical protein [Gemmatimonadaceae bacterium]